MWSERRLFMYRIFSVYVFKYFCFWGINSLPNYSFLLKYSGSFLFDSFLFFFTIARLWSVVVNSLCIKFSWEEIAAGIFLIYAFIPYILDCFCLKVELLHVPWRMIIKFYFKFSVFKIFSQKISYFLAHVLIFAGMAFSSSSLRGCMVIW